MPISGAGSAPIFVQDRQSPGAGGRLAESGLHGAKASPAAPPYPNIVENDMTEITFKRIAEDEARIIAGGEKVGDLYRHRDILKADSVLFIAHLDEDWRGPVTILDRSRIREVVTRMVDTHPLWG